MRHATLALSQEQTCYFQRYSVRLNEAQQAVVQILNVSHSLNSRGLRLYQHADAAGRPDVAGTWDRGPAAESSEVMETRPDVWQRSVAQLEHDSANMCVPSEGRTPGPERLTCRLNNGILPHSHQRARSLLLVRLTLKSSRRVTSGHLWHSLLKF